MIFRRGYAVIRVIEKLKKLKADLFGYDWAVFSVIFRYFLVLAPHNTPKLWPSIKTIHAHTYTYIHTKPTTRLPPPPAPIIRQGRVYTHGLQAALRPRAPSYSRKRQTRLTLLLFLFGWLTLLGQGPTVRTATRLGEQPSSSQTPNPPPVYARPPTAILCDILRNAHLSICTLGFEKKNLSICRDVR